MANDNVDAKPIANPWASKSTPSHAPGNELGINRAECSSDVTSWRSTHDGTRPGSDGIVAGLVAVGMNVQVHPPQISHRLVLARGVQYPRRRLDHGKPIWAPDRANRSSWVAMSGTQIDGRSPIRTSSATAEDERCRVRRRRAACRPVEQQFAPRRGHRRDHRRVGQLQPAGPLRLGEPAMRHLNRGRQHFRQRRSATVGAPDGDRRHVPDREDHRVGRQVDPLRRHRRRGPARQQILHR